MSNALLATYSPTKFSLARGEGARVWDDNDREYLDFGSGIAVTSLGHCHPHLVQAMQEQSTKIWHTSNIFRMPGQENLAQRLCDNSFADRVFFCNSGAEAMEASIKVARKYHAAKGHPERFRIITFEGAFHGRTLATIAAGGQAKYLEGFGPKVDGFDQVPFNDVDAVREAITDETAAILIEPIQGEGGVRPAPKPFLQALRKLCDENGLLLIFDEVQTGMGRTGHLFAYQLVNVTPDIMGLAKGIGGGFPLGACLATEEAGSGMAVGTHGTTYGGNPMAVAIGNAVMDVMMEEGFLEHVRAMAGYLNQKLSGLVDSHPKVFERVQGEGLLLGLKCVAPAGDVMGKAIAHGLLPLTAGDNVLRLAPPLVISKEEIDEAVERLDTAASDVAATSGE
ncbi:MAG: aspartate aminotransferase family protein [Hyphomicrobiales bacterium]